MDKKHTVNANINGKDVSVNFRSQISKDTIGSHYSIHLAEILDAVNSRVEKQKDK